MLVYLWGHEGEITAARLSMASMIEHERVVRVRPHARQEYTPSLSPCMGLKCCEDTLLPNLLSKLTREKGPRILALMNKSHDI